MAKGMIRPDNKKCVMCKHWNGTKGGDSVNPKIGGVFQYEMTEKQKCYKQCKDTQATYTCAKFEPRY